MRTPTDQELPRQQAETLRAEHSAQPGEIHTQAIAEPGLKLRLESEARRLSTQHQQLNEFFTHVMSALKSGSLQATRAWFIRFRDALEAHLSLEDKVFFPAFRGLRPELAEALTGLFDEHERFRVWLDQLHDLLAVGSAEAFATQFDDLAVRLSEHERREEEILKLAAS